MSISKLFDGYNAGYVQDLFDQFSRNPEGVPPAWRRIFEDRQAELVREGLLLPDAFRENGVQPDGPSAPPVAPTTQDDAGAKGERPPTAQDDSGTPGERTATPPAPSGAPGERAPATTIAASGKPTGSGHAGDEARLLPLIARATALIQAFRDHGHQLAQVDPLGTDPPGHPQLDPSFFGTSMEELGRIPTSLILEDGGDRPVSETLEHLRRIYCGSVGYQFEHLEDPDRVRWLWNEVESGRHSEPLDAEDRKALLERLSQVEGMEAFLHRAYLGQKRFSIEGTDMMVPMLDEALNRATSAGARKAVLGMAHRGRLNVLVHIVGIRYEALLREFEGAPQTEGALADATTAGTGDVKYHHGARGTYETRDGSNVEINLAPNPSHLEFVNPVVAGMTRSLQFEGPGADAERDEDSVIPILIHGDAAFAAEGVVAESLNMARLRGYTVGGIVHLIANNQVGFTTNPDDGRSTRYASDLAKGYDIPVVHVNADDPEACLAAMRLAMAYRARFHDDMVIDLVGYRRWGHNEGDEPSYTQPALYDVIDDHPTVRTLLADRLVDDGVMTQDEVDEVTDRIAGRLREAQEQVKEEKEEASHDPFPPPPPEPEPIEADTPVDLELLTEVNTGSLEVPDDFQIHPKLQRQLKRRSEEFGADTKLDWAHAETLAFGTLLREGLPIRMSGQDSERGTFSQRHLVFHDHESGERVLPLSRLSDTRFEVYNSPLSEMGVLGFEYGYSVMAEPDLVLWEAQFGDFVNVAQTVIDQFIASGRTKWGQISSLTLLLPHGYEGQGPEHSSARLERFLQLCAEDNMRVAYPTTPAQYFHLLRRQALGTPKRPLVVMTPKSLLRHPRATSEVRELTRGEFRSVLPDPLVDGGEDKVTRLLLCSGKVYYDLVTQDEREELEHVAIERIEGLYPFPTEELEEQVARFDSLEEVIWVQEEPRNMGALSYIGPHLRAAIPRTIPLRHVSRPERASPAEGRARSHEAKQRKLVRDALGLED